MVDALDEAEHNLKNDLLGCITDEFEDKLPKWCALLVTSRPELKVQEELEELRPTWLDEADHKEDCGNDARVFLRAILTPPLLQLQQPLEEAIELLAQKSELNFLYLNYIRKHVDDRVRAGDVLDVGELPDGLAGTYEEQLERIMIDLPEGVSREDVMTIISTILGAAQPLLYDTELVHLSKVSVATARKTLFEVRFS